MAKKTPIPIYYTSNGQKVQLPPQEILKKIK